MRIEPFTKGDLVHVVKRGARGLDIVLDDSDRWNFIKSLYLFNDTFKSDNWRRETEGLGLLQRPAYWPVRQPIVRILAWTLLANHFHLLLQEVEDGGISRFMQRLCCSMSLCFNLKNAGKGSIFQGAYKAKRVDKDDYFRYLIFYIQVKNLFEMYPGGIRSALEDFDHAWEWALRYPFSSFQAFALGVNAAILDDSDNLLSNIKNDALFTKEESFRMLTDYFQHNIDAFEAFRF